MLGRSRKSIADLRIIQSTVALGLLSLECRLAMTVSTGRTTVSCGVADSLPLLMIAGLIVCVGVRMGSRPIACLGFGTSMIAIAFIYLPDATEAALHFGRGFAYADASLAIIDRAIAFDWMAYALWMDTHHGLWTIGRTAYLSMPLLPVFVVVALSLAEDADRLAAYFVSQMLCLTAVAAIAVFVPAVGAYEYYHAATVPFAHHDFVTADYMTESLNWLQQARLIGNGVTYHGLVSFPSYHAMSCVVDAWALWRVRWARWPMVALCGLILIATPVQGSHYLIDIIAGIVIAFLAIKPSKGLVVMLSRQPAPEAPSPALASA